MKRLIIASALLSLGLIGCQPQAEIDQQLLKEYKRAIPSTAQLEAQEVTATTATALGQPAIIPENSYGLIAGTNGAVAHLIDTLDAVTDLPPTVYNSDTLEFVWGPFDNDDGIGYVAVYVRDVRDVEGEDFDFHYAFLRGVDNDLAKLAPVIWGGATPDPENEDYGLGVALVDFEANYSFEERHNPNAKLDELERGRFAVVFGAGKAEDNPDAEIAFVVAAFRGFQAAGEEIAGDLDYMYGRYSSNAPEDKFTVDFVNWATQADVNNEGDGKAEDLDVRMAFLNEGTGRAEAQSSGGSLEAGQSGELIECWDTSINQTFLQVAFIDAEQNRTVEDTLGAESDCGAIFQNKLDDLEVPRLSDIDKGLLDALDQVARTGVPAE